MRIATGGVRRIALMLGAVATLAACSSLLDVENPNNVSEDALVEPASAGPMVNGLLAATVRMLSGTTVPYAVATDELDWIGSRDAWLELERGGIANPANEFSDQAFPFVGEARFLTDQTIARLTAFDAAGTLTNRALLAQAYLYGAIVYSTIPDMYDDFAFSSKQSPKAPVGRANMVQLYDSAVVFLDRALTIANSGTSAAFTSLRYPIMAYRARVKHARAVWATITPKLAAGANRTVTLINNAGATADANAALLLGTADQAFTLVNNREATAGINLWFEVNGRNEQRTGTVYRTLVDPVTGALDVRVQTLLTQFSTSGGPAPAPTGAPTQAGTFTITNNREMRLILAEAALASGDNAGFMTQINAIRSLDAGRTAWDGVTPAALAMLQHERQAQLWLMRRRLADMHRFNLKDSRWVAVTGFESTFNINGLLFPIPLIERLGNPCVEEPTRAGC
jgi:starch-binding outer membrane protein, SusD/RagB family